MALIAGVFLWLVLPGLVTAPAATALRPAMRAVGGLAVVLGFVLLFIQAVVSLRRQRADPPSAPPSSMRASPSSSSVLPPAAASEATSRVAMIERPVEEEPLGAGWQPTTLAETAPPPLPQRQPGASGGLLPLEDAFPMPSWADTEIAAPGWAETRMADAPIEQRAMVMPPQPEPATAWSAAVFPSIEWRRFEALCEAFFAQAGFTTQSQSHGADGGVDIRVQSRNSPEPRIVRCKHWNKQPVEVDELRSFLGAIAAGKLAQGTYVTSSTFSAEATAFARANNIALLDGATLLRHIGKRTPAQQTALLDAAQQGEFWRPTCASCGDKMVERISAIGGRAFWGCINHPRCQGRSINMSTAYNSPATLGT